MTSSFELTSSRVIAAGAAATTHAAGGAFWRRLAERDPDLAPADGGWLVPVRAGEVVAQLGAPSRRRDRALRFRPVHPAPAHPKRRRGRAAELGARSSSSPGAPGTPPVSAPGPSSRTSPVGWHDL